MPAFGLNPPNKPSTRNTDTFLSPQQPFQTIYGYKIRDPYPKESQYFQANPTVTGMATEDNAIILNPYSKLSQVEFQAVAQNEGARLYMRENNLQPDFTVTPAQRQTFAGTPYAADELALKHTIAARILSGDPSVGETTPEQQQWVEQLRKALAQR